ncbi:Ig-like domain-containing protein, partial [Anaerotignum lactatifermentans]|uniref:Ig-like domain-containing protein n=1 Tax=Anaerotignum lactatifermentans TaxID=160404 RepID=UPI00255CF7B4
VSPDNATDRTVTWESNATNIATVDNNGAVTAKVAGTATITAKAGEQTATCKITVTKADVKVTQITISGKNTLNVNETTTLIANVQPGDATNNTVVWTSENPDVVKVENGKVTALMPGQAVIKATAQDGSNTVGMFTIKVNVSNVDTLRTKVATARELMKDIQVSSDGTDVAPTEKWVPQAQKAALDTAVAEADKILEAPLTSQNTVNAAYTKLQNAMTDFQKAVKSGTKQETPTTYSFWNLW